MNPNASALLAQWWLHGVDAEAPKAPPRSGHSATWAAVLARQARHLLQHLRGHDKPQTAQELMQLARKVEADMPEVAAELRAIAMHRSSDLTPVATPR